MAAKDNLTKTAAIQTTAREVDFVTRFQRNWEHLQEIMGITRMVRKTPGTVLKTKYAEVTLQSGAVGEGEEIPYSEATVKTKDYDAITVEKYAKGVSIEAINEHGYDDAINRTDEQFLYELQQNVTGKYFTFINGGTLKATFGTFQEALAMAQGMVRNKWKKMHRGITDVVGFANILDAYAYLGAANITVQSEFGLNYIENFLGYKRLFLMSDDEIAQGRVIATPADNLITYFVSPSDSDFAKAGLEFTTQGETPIIGFHVKGDYKTAVSESYALLGLTVMAEYIDGVAVINFGADPVDAAYLTSLSIGNLTLTPAFDPAVDTYTAATTAASNKVTAAAKYTDASLLVKNGSTEIENGSSATWSAGENTVTVKVTNDNATKTYTVTVTKS